MSQRAPATSASGVHSGINLSVLRFTCPFCRAYLKAPVQKAGMAMSCTACKKQVAVPEIVAVPTIRFSCPKCMTLQEQPETLAGATVACAKCRQHLKVPGAVAPEVPEAIQKAPVKAAPHKMLDLVKPSLVKKLRLDSKNRPVIIAVSVGGGVLLLGLLILWLDPTRVLMGKLAGDPFLDGRPLRYWVGELKDKLPSTRRDAVVKIRQMGPAAKSAVPALAQVLSDPDAGVRVVAAMALGDLGENARSAVPALLVATQDREPFIRKAAQDALKNIDPQEAARAGIK